MFLKSIVSTANLSAIPSAVFAGMLNGSFAVPVKHARQWEFEQIWLNYAIWGFLIIPWVSIFLLSPNVYQIYRQIPITSIIILAIGGMFFGVGQICFAKALEKIELGLSVVLNIGVGTSLGFLLPLVILHPNRILTLFGFFTGIGCLLCIGGLVAFYKAGKNRDVINQPDKTVVNHDHKKGVILGVLAGLFSGGQNLTFATTHNIQLLAINTHISHLASSIIVWPLFLSFAFVPYGLYMVHLHIKHKSTKHYFQPTFLFNSILTVVMSLFMYGSLIFYSKAALLLGDFGPVITWPLFMVSIILTANFWGWYRQEWYGCQREVIYQALFATGLLVAAIFMLSYSLTFP